MTRNKWNSERSELLVERYNLMDDIKGQEQAKEPFLKTLRDLGPIAAVTSPGKTLAGDYIDKARGKLFQIDLVLGALRARLEVIEGLLAVPPKSH